MSCTEGKGNPYCERYIVEYWTGFSYEEDEVASPYDRVPFELQKALIKVLDDWFQAVQDKTANLRLPDVSGDRYSKEQVDKFIKTLDDYSQEQVDSYPTYFHRVGMETYGKEITEPTNFNELEGEAREAFMQTAKACFKKEG